MFIANMLCTSCKKEVEDNNGYVACGYAYHIHCFRCAGCNRSLGQEGTIVNFDLEEKPVCETCFGKKLSSLKKCDKCKKKILPQQGKKIAEMVEVADKVFHIKCFKCSKCKVVLDGTAGKECVEGAMDVIKTGVWKEPMCWNCLQVYDATAPRNKAYTI